MTAETLLAFLAFAFVTSATPGPNNAMLLASGVNHGFRRTVPHLFGIGFGVAVMVTGVGFGLGAVLASYPAIYGILRWAGAAYLLYLAWKIATAAEDGTERGMGRPMGFLGAAAFQWVNPKTWVIAVGTATTYVPPQHSTLDIVLLGATFWLVGLPSMGLWAGFGSGLRELLQAPHRRRVFNVVMALLLVASLYPLLESTGG